MALTSEMKARLANVGVTKSLINWDRIEEDEGKPGDETALYTIEGSPEKSGVTVLSGIDLAYSYDDLVTSINDLVLNESDAAKRTKVIEILGKVKGKKGADAYAALKGLKGLSEEEQTTVNDFFNIQKEGQDPLYRKVQDNFNAIKEKGIIKTYNKVAGDDGIQFKDLNEEWREVIATSYFQYGEKGVQGQALYGQIAKGEKDKAIKNLQDWGDKTKGLSKSINNRYKKYGDDLEKNKIDLKIENEESKSIDQSNVNTHTPGTYNYAFKEAALKGATEFEYLNRKTGKVELHKVEYKEPEQTSSLNNDQMFDLMRNEEFDFDNIPYEDEGEITYG